MVAALQGLITELVGLSHNHCTLYNYKLLSRTRLRRLFFFQQKQVVSLKKVNYVISVTRGGWGSNFRGEKVLSNAGMAPYFAMGPNGSSAYWSASQGKWL